MENAKRNPKTNVCLTDIDRLATGENLFRLRKKRGFTQDKLADEFSLRAGRNISIVSISKWENGHLPSPDNLSFLAYLYQVSLDDLVVTYAKSQKDDAGNDPVVPLQITLAA